MQGTGHGAGARGGELGGAILVKTERMRGIEIDAVSRAARVEAGVLWAEVAEAAGRTGWPRWPAPHPTSASSDTPSAAV